MIDTLTFVIIVLIIIFFIFTLWVFGDKKEKEANRKLKESLEDGLLFDPVTGAKITLEQAESGNWLLPDEEIKERNELEQDMHFADAFPDIFTIIDTLKELGYTKKIFTDSQIGVLEETEILSKYDDWSFSYACSNNVGTTVLIPSVILEARHRNQSYFNEPQLMFWVKVNHDNGHYYIREKSASEKVFDIFRDDDDIKMSHYESFTIQKGSGILTAIRILQKFNDIRGIEAELHNDNLFIKTMKKPDIEDYKLITAIIKNIT